MHCIELVEGETRGRKKREVRALPGFLMESLLGGTNREHLQAITRSRHGCAFWRKNGLSSCKAVVEVKAWWKTPKRWTIHNAATHWISINIINRTASIKSFFTKTIPHHIVCNSLYLRVSGKITHVTSDGIEIVMWRASPMRMVIEIKLRKELAPHFIYSCIMTCFSGLSVHLLPAIFAVSNNNAYLNTSVPVFISKEKQSKVFELPSSPFVNCAGICVQYNEPGLIIAQKVIQENWNNASLQWIMI